MREPRFDVLFEPVQIGPVTARNRFFQVPHCNGMGYRDPTAHAHMRGIKAEGGWAVVCTEEVEIHASSEVAPFIETPVVPITLSRSSRSRRRDCRPSCCSAAGGSRRSSGDSSSRTRRCRMWI